MTRRVAWLLALFCSGCGSWQHPHKSDQTLARDKADCAAKAGQAAGPNDPYALIFRSVFENCMAGEGWERK